MEQPNLFRYYCFAQKTPKEERAVPYSMYKISYSYDLEKQKDYEIKIGPPEEMADFFQCSGEYPLSPLPYRI